MKVIIASLRVGGRVPSWKHSSNIFSSGPPNSFWNEIECNSIDNPLGLIALPLFIFWISTLCETEAGQEFFPVSESWCFIGILNRGRICKNLWSIYFFSNGLIIKIPCDVLMIFITHSVCCFLILQAKRFPAFSSWLWHMFQSPLTFGTITCQ